MRKAVFLDRDGVLNRAIVRYGKPYPPANLKELEILPGVKSALQNLEQAGYMLIVVTNQPDVARGTTTKVEVEQINNALSTQLHLDDFRICFHDTSDDCNCRKPRSGMLLAAANEYGIDLAASFMVGDRWRDIEAGRNAGCKTVFIDYGYDEKQPEKCDFRVSSLAETADVILSFDK